MVQIPAILLFLIGVVVGAILGAVTLTVIAINYKGDVRDGREEKGK